MPLWILIWLYLLSANLLAFTAFGIDKARAINGEWRISEGSLILMATVGGTGGAYLGRWYFRHKTRKLSFSNSLHLISALQLLLVGWLFIRA